MYRHHIKKGTHLPDLASACISIKAYKIVIIDQSAQASHLLPTMQTQNYIIVYCNIKGKGRVGRKKVGRKWFLSPMISICTALMHSSIMNVRLSVCGCWL